MMVFERLSKELREDEDVYNVMSGTSIKNGSPVKAYMRDEEYEIFKSLEIKFALLVHITCCINRAVFINIHIAVNNILYPY